MALTSSDTYQVINLTKVDSTNKYALSNHASLRDKTLITADEQTSGYGRNGKLWTSRPNIDIIASFVYKISINKQYILTPLVIAVGLNRLFKELGVLTKIKWPNDILLPDKTKIAGILVESKVQSKSRVLVIGIGLDNILMWDKKLILRLLIKHIDIVVNQYFDNGFALLRLEWIENCIHYKKRVMLMHADKLIVEGEHNDITVGGDIIIKDENGHLIKYNGSQISLRFDTK